MKKFVLLTYGFEQPTEAVMQAWGQWFAAIKDKMVESGGPFGAGKEISKEDTKDLPLGKDALTGYVVLNAENFNEAEAIAKSCPAISSVRLYETMQMDK